MDWIFTGVLRTTFLKPNVTPVLLSCRSSLSLEDRIRIGSVLRNLFQALPADMAEWFEVDTNPDGSTPRHFSIWEKGLRNILGKRDDSPLVCSCRVSGRTVRRGWWPCWTLTMCTSSFVLRISSRWCRAPHGDPHMERTCRRWLFECWRPTRQP